MQPTNAPLRVINFVRQGDDRVEIVEGKRPKNYKVRGVDTPRPGKFLLRHYNKGNLVKEIPMPTMMSALYRFDDLQKEAFDGETILWVKGEVVQ